MQATLAVYHKEIAPTQGALKATLKANCIAFRRG